MYRDPDAARHRRCMVASPGVSPVSAFTSAALAMGSPGSVKLVEDLHMRWSSSTFLGSAKDGNRKIHGSEEDRSHIWNVGSGVDSGCGGLELKHLGCVGENDLAHLESLAATGSLAGMPPPGEVDLVWCQVINETGLLSSGYVLGRVVQLLKPGRIRVLVFPDAWSGAGRPGWIEDVVQDDPDLNREDLLALIGEIAGSVCDGGTLDIRCVGGGDNSVKSFTGEDVSDSFWRNEALEILKDPAVC